MIAATLTRPKNIELKNVPKPNLTADEALIKVEGCGICASSIPLWEGREWFSYPSEPGTPGHEGWGVVEAVGEQMEHVRPGDRVAFLSNHAFAEYDKASATALLKLPPEMNGKAFPGEPLGCALNIFDRSDIREGDTVAIIGTGFLGSLLCQLAKSEGANVIAISRRKYSLDFAKQFGADEEILFTDTWEVAGKVAEITAQQGCRRVIEATGKQEALDVATEIVAEGGRIIIAGYHQDGLRQVNLQQWNWKGIDVINAHERDPEKYQQGMQKALQAVVSGRLKPESLYTDVLPLSELNKGFALTAGRPDGFMKALVEIG